MGLKAYNPKEVQISVYGYPIEGWVSCTVNRDEDETTEQRGADGTLSTTLNSNEGGTVELEILQEGEANRFIAGLTTIRQRTGLLPRFLMQITDPSGSVVETLEGTYLKRGASSNVAATAGTKTHTFYAETISPSPVPDGYEGDAADILALESILSAIEASVRLGGL